METIDKFKLLNKMGKCEVHPAIAQHHDIEQKYCVTFKIWTGTIWVPTTWSHGREVDVTIDKLWEELKSELWIFVTQIEAGH